MLAKTINCPFYCGEIDFREIDKLEADGWQVDDLVYVPDDGLGTVRVRMLKEDKHGQAG